MTRIAEVCPLTYLEVISMKLSCLPVSYFKNIISGDLTIGQWAREASKLGLDAIDLSIIFLRQLDAARLKNIRKEIEDAGIQVAVVTTYPDFTHPDEDERKQQLFQMKTDISTSAFLGAKMVRITAGQGHPGIPVEKGIEWAADGLLSSKEAANHNGIRLLFENHSKPGVWEYFDFSHPTEIFLRIAERISDSEIKLLFDTANTLAYGDDPLELLEKVIKKIECVHIADISEKGSLEPVEIGTGIVPIREILKRLKQTGYEGWLSIEEASGLGSSGIMNAVNFVRKAWDEV